MVSLEDQIRSSYRGSWYENHITHSKINWIWFDKCSCSIEWHWCVCVLLLHYTPQFIKSGLTELWLKYGIGPKVPFMPLHIFIARLDQNLLDVIESPHDNRMWCYQQNLKSDPHMYLNNFGENELLESSFVDAE